MTISLTVIQAGQSQDTRSSAAVKKNKTDKTKKSNTNNKKTAISKDSNKQQETSKDPTKTALKEINDFRKSNRLGALSIQSNL